MFRDSSGGDGNSVWYSTVISMQEINVAHFTTAAANGPEDPNGKLTVLCWSPMDLQRIDSSPAKFLFSLEIAHF